MALFQKNAIGVIVSILALSSIFTVLGQENGLVSSSLAPLHSLVSIPPVESPKPPHHHHHPNPHHHHYHSQQPASSPSHSSPPVKTPTSQPVKPPTTLPVKPPAQPVKPPVKAPSPLPSTTRKYVGVRGVVYCKSCKYRGVDTLLEASPLVGAVVKLACNNTKYHLTELGTTDKNGFFFIQPKWLTTTGYHKCKVFLAKSPKAECSVPTNFHNGQNGAVLNPAPLPPMTSTKPPVENWPGDTVKLFDVGPFAFEPSKDMPCKKKL